MTEPMALMALTVCLSISLIMIVNLNRKNLLETGPRTAGTLMQRAQPCGCLRKLQRVYLPAVGEPRLK